MIIQMANVTYHKEQSNILQQVNWTVRSGEHWAIMGLNGSGKTTLLNMINGYIWPTQGEISVLGNPFGTIDLRELRKSIGWASSSLQERFYVNETTAEIVLSGKFATIGLYDQPKAQDVEQAHLLLEELGCQFLVKRSYKTLSQGEKQKVLIARALMGCPKLLILDEPCTGLDVFSREQLLTTIQQIGQGTGPTLLYVTHHIEEILPVFSHTLLLRKGEVHSAGQTEQVLTSNNLSRFFHLPVEVQQQNGRFWMHPLTNIGITSGEISRIEVR